MKKVILLLAFFIVSSAYVQAQELKLPSPSPAQTIKQEFGLSEITITYSRPSAKGRTMIGGQNPYGQVWRTGANFPTKIKFGEEVKVNGTAVPAGEYALYTIPNPGEWEIILSKNTKLWGSFGYKPDEDQLRFKVKSQELPFSVETFTILFANHTPTSLDIQLVWEKHFVSFNVATEVDSKAMANIDAAMKGDKKPYFQAAAYYYENNKDVKKALEWVTEAAKADPKAYWVDHLKAKIQLKLKDYKGAIASAESSKTKAKEQGNPEYVVLNDKLIAEAKKGI